MNGGHPLEIAVEEKPVVRPPVIRRSVAVAASVFGLVVLVCCAAGYMYIGSSNSSMESEAESKMSPATLPQSIDERGRNGASGDVGPECEAKLKGIVGDEIVDCSRDGCKITGKWSSCPASQVRLLDIADACQGDQVTHITLQGCKVEGDINALSRLPALTYLDLGHSSITGDISSLASLTLLTGVYLSGCASVTGDIKDLSSLTTLTKLHLRGATHVLGDIKHLSALTALTDLDIGSTTVTGDIKALSSLSAMKVLHLRMTSVTGDISVLSSLRELQSLSVAHTKVEGSCGDIVPHMFNHYTCTAADGRGQSSDLT